jgi:hypothetical protein
VQSRTQKCKYFDGVGDIPQLAGIQELGIAAKTNCVPSMRDDGAYMSIKMPTSGT